MGFKGLTEYAPFAQSPQRPSSNYNFGIVSRATKSIDHAHVVRQVMLQKGEERAGPTCVAIDMLKLQPSFSSRLLAALLLLYFCSHRRFAACTHTCQS